MPQPRLLIAITGLVLLLAAGATGFILLGNRGAAPEEIIVLNENIYKRASSSTDTDSESSSPAATQAPSNSIDFDAELKQLDEDIQDADGGAFNESELSEDSLGF